MRTAILAVIIGAAVFAAVFFLLAGRQGGAPQATSEPAQAAGPSAVQRDKGEGAVEIEVTWVTPESGGADAARLEPDKYTVFAIAMNTHSVDLSGYDMVKISELIAGGTTLSPLRWVGTSDDSHHRSGVLVFAKVTLGQALELRIKTIAGVPVRTFRWTP